MDAVIRRTWRFLPSINSSAIQQSGTLLRNRIGRVRGGISGCGSNSHARHGSVFRPWIEMPLSSFPKISGVGIFSTCAQYSRSCAWRGCRSFSFHAGSSLNSSNPSESASSRPIGQTFFGNPNSASVRLVEPSPVNCDSTPNGLWNAMSTIIFNRQDAETQSFCFPLCLGVFVVNFAL